MSGGDGDATRVTNATNVACHMAGSRLSFFIRLSQRESSVLLGSVKDGRIVMKQGEEELPYTVSLKLHNTGAIMNLNTTRNTLRSFTGSHSLLKDRTEADAALYWALENDDLLSINVNMAGFYEAVASAPAGNTVRLVKANTRLTNFIFVDLTITCPARAEFPPGYLHSISNPRFSASPSRADALTAEESSQENSMPLSRRGDDDNASRSPPAVARQLSMAGSVTPEAGRERRWTQMGRSVGENGSPSMYSQNASPGEMIRQDDTLTVDATSRQNIRLLFYPAQYGGNVFKRYFPVLGDIGVELLIQIAEEDDPRVAPKKEPRRPSSSSSFSLYNANKGNDIRNKHKAVNVSVDLQEDPVRREKCLVIAFNGEETHATMDMTELLAEGGYLASSTAAAVGRGGQANSFIVASCSNLVKANYIIDLSVVRVVNQMPSEREVYIAVESYFYRQGYVSYEEDDEEMKDSLLNYDGATEDPGQLRQYTLDMLKNLEMDSVRDYLFQSYSNFVSSASLEERQQFSSLIWSCTRDCIINKVFGREEPLLDHVGDFVTDMLPV